MAAKRRNICFVTGTRAEFGLMRSVLEAIRSHPKLRLQIAVTGMHLSRDHGSTIRLIRQEGWKVDRIVSWRQRSSRAADVAATTGRSLAALAEVYDALKSDVVLVVGDRVEAFAAAAAGYISGRIVAHVHGGDRAAGLIDDSLRHAVTKLSHLHFPATRESARRIIRMGESPHRVHRVGSPGLDGIAELAETMLPLPHGGSQSSWHVLLLLHPTDGDERLEASRMELVMRALERSPVPRLIAVHPNNDPGWRGIAAALDKRASSPRWTLHRNLARPRFLGLMRSAVALIGNSSSGIIEAASLGTPVINIGDRQLGRQRSGNVVDVPFDSRAIEQAIKTVWNHGRPRRSRARNVYGAGGAGLRIASILAAAPLDALRRKLIAY